MAERTRTITRHLQPLPNPARKDVSKQRAADTNPYLVGNFAPTATEGEFTDLEVVEGEVPYDLRGSYMRIGPNPRFDFSGMPYHIFDGDGFIHSFTFPADGVKPFYVKRWVRTRRLITSEARGYDCAEVGEQMIGSFQHTSHIIDDTAPGYSSYSGQRMGRANTNIASYANRVFALEEGDFPYEIVASWDASSHLRTAGRFDFNKELNSPVTAHPKIDPQTGEMVFFSYDPLQPKATYGVGSREGTLIRTLEIELPDTENGSMIHDFTITKNFSLLFDSHINFTTTALGGGKNPWVHRKSIPARFAVFPRHVKSTSEIVWIDVEPCAVLHFANAWEEDDGTIVVVGCRLNTWQFTKVSRDSTEERMKPAHLHMWVLDLKQRKCIHERQISEHPVDFVQIDPARVGRKVRYVYGLKLVSSAREIQSTPEYKNAFFLNSALLKFDLVTGEVHEINYSAENNNAPTFGAEAVFAPRMGRIVEEEEDSGYLVLITHNEANQTSHCVVYDAASLKLQCKIRSPERIPYGFHAHWVNGDILK